jgi:uncharacterized membrane protein
VKTREHALVRRYLAAVEEETAALPAERRKELLADLTEHISVALAEAGDETDESVQRVLDQLGTPSAIAESALAEEPAPSADELHADSDLRIGLILILLPLAGSVGVFFKTLGLVTGLLGITLLWTSKEWNLRDRIIGTFIPVSSTIVWIGLELLVVPLASGSGLPPVIVTGGLAFAVPVLGSVYLFRAARRHNASRATLRS